MFEMTMTKKISIEKYLEELDPALYAQYQRVVERAQELLPRTYRTFATFTEHGLSHSHAVVQIIDQLLPQNVLDTFSAEECFVLLAGATLHDIGMATAEAPNEEGWDSARQAHHVSGAHALRSAPEVFGVDSRFAPAVAQLIRHHRESNIADQVRQTSVGHTRVRLPLLCALVRAGDELHITDDRAPEIVIANLTLPEESMEHFLRCHAVMGVAPDSSHPGVMVISAKVSDIRIQTGMTQLVEKINEELAELQPVFDEYDVPAVIAELDLDRLDIVSRKTLLTLCSGPCSLSELCNLTGEPSHETKDALVLFCNKYWVNQRICEDGEDVFELSSDPGVFRALAEDLLVSADAMDFVGSKYARNMLHGAMFDELCSQFSAAYDEQEADIRREVLRASPSALRLALLSSDVARNPSFISRRVLLDEALLLGLSNDIYLRPEIADCLDVGSAMRHLARHVSSRASPFGRIISRAWQYRDFTPQEMSQKLLEEYAGPPVPGADTHIHARFEGPAEPQFLSPPHLMVASIEEGVPLEISAPQLVDLSIEGTPSDQLNAGDWHARSLTMTPAPGSPQMPPGHIPVRYECIDDEGNWRVTFDTSGSFDPSLYPSRMAVTFDPASGESSLKPTPHFGLADAARDVDELRFLHSLYCGESMTVSFIDGRTHKEVGTAQLQAIRESEDLIVVVQARLAMTQVLSAVQERLDREISVPLLPPLEQEDRITDLGDELHLLSDEELGDKLAEIASTYRPYVTLIRIIAISDEGKRVIDECPRMLPGFVEISIEATNSDEQKEIDGEIGRLLASDGAPIVTRYWTRESPEELIHEYLSAISKGSLRAPAFTVLPKPPIQTEVEYTVEPISERQWERLQQVILRVEARPWHRRLVDTASDLIEENDPETAIENLTRCILHEPKYAPAHYELARAFYNMKQLDKAERSFRNALSLDLGTVKPVAAASAIIYLGTIQLHRGSSEVAIKEFETIDPQFLPAVCDHGLSLLRTRFIDRNIHVDKAQEAYQALEKLCAEAGYKKDAETCDE